MSQTAYSNAPALARAGMLADSFESQQIAAVASGSVRVGYGAQILAQATGIRPALVGEIAAPAVDVDAVIATIASAAAAQTVTSLDGVGVGGSGALMNPARKLSLTTNSHADWDATTAIVRGWDAAGNYAEATILIPNGGNTTAAQVEDVFFSRVKELYIPAQTGTTGTATLGVTADIGEFAQGTLVLPLYDASREPYNSSNQYVDEDPMQVLKRGRAWVALVAGTAGQQVFVRMVESGSNYRGELRGGAATGFTGIRGSRIIQMSGSTLGLIELA
jgi:hypothetical protein